MKLNDKTLTIRDNTVILHLGEVDYKYLQNKSLTTNTIRIVPNCLEFIPGEKYLNVNVENSLLKKMESKGKPIIKGTIFFISNDYKLKQLIIYKDKKSEIIEHGDLFTSLYDTQKKVINDNTTQSTPSKHIPKFLHVDIYSNTFKAIILYGTEYTLYKCEIDLNESNNSSIKYTTVFDVSNFPDVYITNVFFPNYKSNTGIKSDIYIQLGNNALVVINYNKSFDLTNADILKCILYDKKQNKKTNIKVSVFDIYVTNYFNIRNNNIMLHTKFISFEHMNNSNVKWLFKINIMQLDNRKQNTNTYLYTLIHSVAISPLNYIAINLNLGQVLLFEEIKNSPLKLISCFSITPRKCTTLLFSYDNNLLVIGSQDNNVYIIDMLTKKPFACLVGHYNYVNDVYIEDGLAKIQRSMSSLRISNCAKNNQIQQVNRNDILDKWGEQIIEKDVDTETNIYNGHVMTTQNNKSQWERYSIYTIGLDGYIGSYEIHRINNDEDVQEKGKNVHYNRIGNRSDINEYMCNVNGFQCLLLNEERMRMMNIEVINPIYMNKDILNLPIRKFWKCNCSLLVMGSRNKEGSIVMLSFFDKKEDVQINPFKQVTSVEDQNILINKFSLSSLNLDNIGMNINTFTNELKQYPEIFINQI